MKHKTLHELLSVEYATVNNLFSYQANTYKGALLQVNKDIKKYLKAGWISQIPFDLKPREKRKQFFYYVTREGAKAIDRLEDYKQKITKSLNNAEHESMKIDIARAFLINFPDYDFDFDYKADLGGLKPDILVKAKNIHSDRQFTFLVEVERKKELTRIYRDKITRYNKFIKDGLFEKNKLSPKTKVLFVCSNHRYDVYWRPQNYSQPEVKPIMDLLYKQFNYFLETIRNQPDKHYRFIPFSEFTKIAEPIWRMPSGTKVRLIE
jgi:hypothetical protein